MNRNKKGQAAMEFLMTYGWAILAAIVVIAVLAIYFRPSSIVSGNQVLTAPFNALGSSFDGGDGTDGEIKVEFKNNGGELANLASASVSITTPSGDTCAAASGDDTSDGGFDDVALDVGEVAILTFVDCTFIVDETVNAQISISYTSGSEGTLSKTSTGTISGKAT